MLVGGGHRTYGITGWRVSEEGGAVKIAGVVDLVFPTDSLTDNGDGTVNVFASQAINTVFAGPGSGGAGEPSFRALVAADIPNLNASKITGGTMAITRGGTGLNSMGAKGGIIVATAPGANTALAVGTNGQVLTADSAEASGVKWATPKKRFLYVPLCQGAAIVAGAQLYEYLVPFSPEDGSTSITWNVRRVEVVVSTPSAGTSTLQLERSTAAGAFAGSNVLSAGLSISGAGTYKASTTAFALTTVASGNRLRLNFSAVDGTHAGFSVFVLLEEA